MQSLNLTELTEDQVIAIADGLMMAKQYRMAAVIYQKANVSSLANRNLARTKLGLAQRPRMATPALMNVLQYLQGITPHVFVGEGLATWNKTLPFYDDPRFVALSEKHVELLPLPNWHWNLQTVLWAAQEARGVEGDFVELGVFKGHTTLFTAEYVDFAAWPKRWLLYDTFEGIPDDQVDPDWELANKAAYGGTFSCEEVTERFAHIPNIRVIKGRVPEILDGTAPEKIAFMHIDLNNATAEIQALDRLFDRISPGGIVVFDDYGWTSARAQHDAENRWFAARGLRILPLPTGQGVFIKR